MAEIGKSFAAEPNAVTSHDRVFEVADIGPFSEKWVDRRLLR
jgi:hypothetical protein